MSRLGVRQPFRSSRGRVKVALTAPERELLARLLDDVSDLLEDSAAEAMTTSSDDSDWAVLEAALSAPPPQDPAVARLLPDGSRDDPDLAAGYRRLTEMGLRAKKQGALRIASAALRRADQVVLSAAEAGALLKGLTDVRLVVAERLGVRTDEDAERLHLALRMAIDAQEPQSAQGPRRSQDQEGPADAVPAWIELAAIYDSLTWWQESLVSAVR